MTAPMRSPIRLMDDPATSAAMRDALAAYSRAPVPVYETPQPPEPQGAQNGTQTTSAAADTTHAVAKLGGVTKLAIVVTGVGAVGTAVVLWTILGGSHATPAPAQPTVSELQARPPVPAVVPVTVETIAETGPPNALELGARSSNARDAPTKATVKHRSRSRSRAPAAKAAGEDDALDREIRQLARAKSALAADPAVALRLVEQGHREFARGRLIHERESVALRALGALGRRAELRRRGRAFLRAYPSSPHADRVRALLATR